jgi:hypothetical protein
MGLLIGLFFFFFFIFKTGSCYVVQAILELVTLLPQFPKCWDYQCATPYLAPGWILATGFLHKLYPYTGFFLFVGLSLFLVGLRFELRALHLQNRPLEPHLQSILLWLFWRWDLVNYLPWLALNCNPPNLSLPSKLGL